MLYSHDIATVEYNANFHTGTDRKTAVPAQGRESDRYATRFHSGHATVRAQASLARQPLKMPTRRQSLEECQNGRQQRNDGA